MSLQRMLNEKPEQVLMKAIGGMLPRNRLKPARLRRLRIFAGPTHTHTAQLPQLEEAYRLGLIVDGGDFEACDDTLEWDPVPADIWQQVREHVQKKQQNE